MRLLLACTATLALAACGAPEPRTSETTSSSTAGALSADSINRAELSVQDAPGATQGSAQAPDPGLIRLQVLLDRTPFSPGVIDGLPGENTRQAVAAYRKAMGLSGDAIDAALMRKLISGDSGAAMTTYVLAAADLEGPFSPPPGDDLAAQAAAGANYSSALERLAERFHTTEQLLQALNPGVDFRRAGVSLVVPAVTNRSLPDVARIVVDKTERSLRAFDAAGELIAFYPATIGSTERPAPSGTLKVEGVAHEPDYTYDPAKLSYDRGDEKVVVPAGPNNPVGSVWIELSRDSYGIHGSPDPTKIAKTASNGCVRLTNWDAEQLAAAVKPGVEVEFI
jgi:lipoprotein-anchoring transpeptidase ErfK/SrfK